MYIFSKMGFINDIKCLCKTFNCNTNFTSFETLFIESSNSHIRISIESKSDGSMNFTSMTDGLMTPFFKNALLINAWQVFTDTKLKSFTNTLLDEAKDVSLTIVVLESHITFVIKMGEEAFQHKIKQG